MVSARGWCSDDRIVNQFALFSLTSRATALAQALLLAADR
jgi:hypothetical protein